MNQKPRFEESELANTIGLLVIRSSRLDYLLRYALAVFIAEDIADNRIYEKAHIIGSKFGKIRQVTDLLKDLVPNVLCRWYWKDFDQLFAEVAVILEKRNSHSHNVFHILDEDTYMMSSAIDHHGAKMGKPGPRKKLQKKHSLKDLKELVKRTSDCLERLEQLLASPSKGPILRAGYLKLPEEQRLEIAKRENRRPTTRKS
jgi:hypothetical protein